MNATFLGFLTGQQPAWVDDLDLNLFYPHSVVVVDSTGEYCETNCLRMSPSVNVICSSISLALLALYLKENTEGASVFPHPIESLVWADFREWQLSTIAWLTPSCMYLQLLWVCRCVVIPVIAGIGTACAMGAAKSSNTLAREVPVQLSPAARGAR